MTDLREVQLMDNTFELTNTIVENEDLTKRNNHLFYLVLTSSILLIVASLYFSKKINNKNSKHLKV